MADPKPHSDETLDRLAGEATDREIAAPPDPVPVDGFFWRYVDGVGPYSHFAAAGLTLLAFLLAQFGGESFAWASLLYLPVTLCLITYALYLLRKYRREKAAEYMQRQQTQEQARREVARLVLEQSQRDQEKPKG